MKLVLLIVAILLLTGMILFVCLQPKKDSFRFQVTPGRKRCLGGKRTVLSPIRSRRRNKSQRSCCGDGFNGKPVRFEYSSDMERFDCSKDEYSKGEYVL
jgi:hypothetical protein